MEAELITTSTAIATINWLQGLNNKANLSFDTVSRVYNDNFNCVTTLGNGNFQATSRHLRIRYYGIHEAIAKQELQVIHVGDPLMIADSLTKALRGPAITKFRTDIGLRAN
jgi:hypothetical protein